MDIEEFVSEENHMCNLGEDLFTRSSSWGQSMIYLIMNLTERLFTG